MYVYFKRTTQTIIIGNIPKKKPQRGMDINSKHKNYQSFDNLKNIVKKNWSGIIFGNIEKKAEI